MSRKVNIPMISLFFMRVAVLVFTAALPEGLPVKAPAEGEVAASANQNGNKKYSASQAVKDDRGKPESSPDLVESAQSYRTNGDEGKTIEALDRAYAFLLKMKGENDPGVTQEKDDLRLAIAKRLTAIYASRHAAALFCDGGTTERLSCISDAGEVC